MSKRDARLQAMLSGPIFLTVLGLAWPNLLMMVAQSSTVMIETWFISHLGVDALAGAALVMPILMLMQSMSQGAMGGGISAAVARALGSGDKALANRLVLHAVVLTAGLGVLCSVILWLFRVPIFTWMGASGPALEAAMTYSGIAYGALTLMWIMNALASAIRGTGNMLVPGAVISGGAIVLIPVSACLIFGWGPIPALGIAGAGWALMLYFGIGAAILLWYCLSGKSLVRLELCQLSWTPMRNILGVGGFAMINPLLTNGLIASTTALVGAYAGTIALAGYGTAARLEYLLFPVAFGIGAPLVAMVASNLGAGQPERALRVALTGGAMAFIIAEIIGLCAAIWPYHWMHLFGSEPDMVETGVVYLQTVGPVFGFFGLGFTLYFASQGARKLVWPIGAGILRLALAISGGWLVLHLSGSLFWFYFVSAIAMFLYGSIILYAIATGTWFKKT